MPRKEISNERYLKERVEAVGGTIRKVKWVAVNGAPDRLCLFLGRGRAAWVEVKEEEQPWGLQPHQEREHRRMRQAGMIVKVLSSKAEIDAFIREMIR